MRRLFTQYKSLAIIISLVAIVFIVPHVTHAAWYDVGSTLVGNIFSASLEIFILPLASLVLYLGGMMMDGAIYFGLHTAYIFSLSPAIDLGWVIVRDICNIFFIFILIYISLGTIVRGTSSFGTKDLLTKVIIAALLINFSLFITKTVIDVSNIFGNWLYGGVQKTLQVNSSNPSTASLSGLITTRLGIINFWSSATPNQSNQGVTDPSQSFTGRILRLAVVLIATYLFFYCSVLFISRSITLLFLMVFSPIGFMGGILPQLEDYAKDWRKELTSAAMFPIAYLLMLYIALQFINSLDKIKSSFPTGSAAGSEFTVAQYFQYFIIIFLLQACLSVAKDNSGKMGKAVEGLADGLGKIAMGVAGGGAAMLGKIAIGGAANRLANSTFINQKVAGGGVTGFVAGSLQNRANKVADFHFDPRAAAGIDGYKPEKGGYKTMFKDMAKTQEEAQKAIAAKPKEIKPAKGALQQAENIAYRAHGEYGAGYNQAQRIVDQHQDAIEDHNANRRIMVEQGYGAAEIANIDRQISERVKQRDEALKDLNKIKGAIDQDGEFEIKKKLLEAQEEVLAEMIENNEDKEKIKAMEAAMRQGRAAKAAETGTGMNVANGVAKTLGDKAFIGKIGRTVAGIATAGFSEILGQASEEYIANNKKIAGKMRDAMDEGKKKKNQQNISGILADLADGGAPVATPGPTDGGTPPTGGTPGGGH